MKYYKDFSDALVELEVADGDNVCVHSDIKKLMYFYTRSKGEFDVNAVINSFINVIGTKGTLLFPTFNWDFNSGIGFNYRKTRSKTGALTTAALKREDFTRTQHPIYSFAVWGDAKNELFAMNNVSSFGADSPFSWLHKSAKGIGIDVRDFTFFHYVEETIGVSYRYIKPFTAEYTDYEGNTDIRTYTLYVRDYDLNVQVLKDPICEKMFELKSLLRILFEDSVRLEAFKFSEMFSIIKKDILENDSKSIVIYDGQNV